MTDWNEGPLDRDRFVRVYCDGRSPFVIDRRRRADLVVAERHYEVWMRWARLVEIEIEQLCQKILDAGGHVDSRRYAGGYNGARIRWSIHPRNGQNWRSWDTWDRLKIPCADTVPMREDLGDRMTKLDQRARLYYFAAGMHRQVLQAAMERATLDEGVDREVMQIRLFEVGGAVYGVCSNGGRLEHLGQLPPPTPFSCVEWK